jgi:hypothetical protein
VATGTLIVEAAAWLLNAVVMAGEAAGWLRRSPAFRWQDAGLLLVMTAALADTWTVQRSWPPGSARTVQLAALAAGLAGLVAVGTGLWKHFAAAPAAVRSHGPGEEPGTQ